MLENSIAMSICVWRVKTIMTRRQIVNIDQNTHNIRHIHPIRKVNIQPNQKNHTKRTFSMKPCDLKFSNYMIIGWSFKFIFCLQKNKKKKKLCDSFWVCIFEQFKKQLCCNRLILLFGIGNSSITAMKEFRSIRKCIEITIERRL